MLEIQFRPVMAALELVAQKYIEERGHFVIYLGISRFWLAQKHLYELRCHIAGDDLPVPPVIVFQTAILECQFNPLGFLVPTMDLEGLSIFQRSR